MERQALRRVEVDGLSVQAFASEAGITPNNAGVRLFRARERLKADLEAAEGGQVVALAGRRRATGRRS